MPSELSAQGYDAMAALYDAEYQVETADIGFYQGLAGRTGGPILELACGSGRVLAGLADPDWAPLVGLDASGAILELAKRRLTAHPRAGPMVERGQVHLIQGDMRSFAAPPGGFALAFCALNSFNHLLEAEDQAACLSCVAGHLKPGGLLALDVFNPEVKDSHPGVHGLDLSGDFRHPETGERVMRLTSVTTDLARQRRRYVYLFDIIGRQGQVRREVHEVTLRYVYRYEMELLLANAGLKLEAVYGGPAFEPYTGREDMMLFVAEKPG